jgi:hypothetical protein
MMWRGVVLSLALLEFFPGTCLASLDSTPHRQLISHRRSSQFQPQSSILSVRGGQSPQDPYNPNNKYANPNYEGNVAPNNSNNYEDGFANYNPPPATGTTDADAEHLFQETVQERVDKWRTAQMEQSQNLTPDQELNPRDEQGRMKLLASVSKGSRAFIFFVLMWRDVHLFEIADQRLKGMARLMAVVPLTVMFLANLAGVVASVTSPSHSGKKRMKAILNLDKIIEVVLLVYYFVRLTVAPDKFVPREIFIANTLHSVFFLIQCQAFTRVTW